MSQGMERMAGAGRAVIGVIFIVSALLKGAEISNFAALILLYDLVQQPAMALGLAIAIVVIEAVLGGAALAGLRLRGLVQGLVIAMLVGFTALFAYGLIARGITDCGCFGSKFQLTPAVSIAKNMVLIAIAAFVLWTERRAPAAEATGAGLRVLKVAATAVPTLLSIVLIAGSLKAEQGRNLSTALAAPTPGAPVPAGTESAAVDPAAASTPAPVVDPDRPFTRFRFEVEGETMDLGTGRWFVPFLSATCDHCREAVPLLNDLPNMQPDLPRTVSLMLGSDAEIAAFREETQPAFPTVPLPALQFMQFMDSAPPRYYIIAEGRAVAHWDIDLPTDTELVQAIYADQIEAQEP